MSLLCSTSSPRTLSSAPLPVRGLCSAPHSSFASPLAPFPWNARAHICKRARLHVTAMQEVATLRDPSLTSFQVLMTAHTPPNPNPSAKDVAAALDSYRTQALTYEPGGADGRERRCSLARRYGSASCCTGSRPHNKLLPAPSPTPIFFPTRPRPLPSFRAAYSVYSMCVG